MQKKYTKEGLKELEEKKKTLEQKIGEIYFEPKVSIRIEQHTVDITLYGNVVYYDKLEELSDLLCSTNISIEMNYARNETYIHCWDIGWHQDNW